MPSNQPIRITFDRPVNEGSVASRFHLVPASPGQVSWPSPTVMVFTHEPLRAGSSYRVVLDAGYSAVDGAVNGLRHGWPFRTEPPPGLTGSAPGPGERDVDPAAYIALDFSRAMDVGSVAGAVTLSPSVPLAVRPDPADSRRVVLAPGSLLSPGTDYSVTVTSQARDVDGNPLRGGFTLGFATGVQRPLRHWIGFTTDADPGSGGDGVWMVDESRFPRQVATGAVDAFAWSPDGTHLLLHSPSGEWSDQPVGGAAQPLPIQATWAAFLAGDRGYAYLDGGRLRQLLPDGRGVDLAAGVSQAAVGQHGLRLAFAAGGEVRGYDLDLRSQYRLQAEKGAITGLAWAPDGSHLAYRVVLPDGRSQLRVRSLTGAGGVTTVATGDISDPAWQADSRHLIFAAAVEQVAGVVSKVYRINVNDVPSGRLDPAAGLPAGPLAVESPQPSPDGHQIAFLSSSNGHSQVWLMNADGTGLVQLTAFDPGFPYSCRALAWTSS